MLGEQGKGDASSGSRNEGGGGEAVLPHGSVEADFFRVKVLPFSRGHQ